MNKSEIDAFILRNVNHDTKSPMAQNHQRIQLGIIGLGRIGKIHLNNALQLSSLATVSGVADPDEESRSWARSRGITHVTPDYREVLEMEGLNAVLICAPTTMHYEMIAECCRLGLDIFCEKPLESSLKKIRDIGELVKASGVRLQVGFQRRFDPNFQKVREGVQQNRLGEVHLIKITSRDPAPPPIDFIKTSGGLFMDMTIHDFDMARFITGQEVEEVFAMADVRVDPAIGKAGDVDTAMITMRFDDRSLVSIDNSRKAIYGYDQRIEVFGSGGMIQTDNKRPDNHLFHDAAGFHGAPPHSFFIERYQVAYKNELKAFLTALEDQAVPDPGIHDALMATAIALAAQKSFRTGQIIRLDTML